MNVSARTAARRVEIENDAFRRSAAAWQVVADTLSVRAAELVCTSTADAVLVEVFTHEIARALSHVQENLDSIVVVR